MRADNTVLTHPYLHGEVVIAAVVEGGGDQRLSRRVEIAPVGMNQRCHRLTIAFAGAAYDG